ncbi:Hypothetical predicted protein [Mytilus galloprovincialis]|uniref:Carboxylesterase type B domain-containing protein n=1 Tax=Mytilus galloprovincialis TaxID=29158 RepID=A0A8B6DLB1_MYTGA|nr:Hypothetical predicted protein [Mytilus galloprovincialis]
MLDFFLNGGQDFFQFNASDHIPKRILCDVLVPDIANVVFNNNTDIAVSICDKYGSASSRDQLSQDILNVYTDLAFTVPAVESLRLHTGNGNGKQFQYIFSKQNSFFSATPYPDWFDGSAHAADLIYLFFPGTLSTDQDGELSMNLLKYWTNFAKTGDVNGEDLPKWEEYDTTNERYINLDINITTGQHMFKDRVDFWLNDIPKIFNPSSSSSSPSSTRRPIIQTSPTSGSQRVYRNELLISYFLLMYVVLCFYRSN